MLNQLKFYKAEMTYFVLMVVVYAFLLWLTQGVLFFIFAIGFPIGAFSFYRSTFKPVFTGMKNNKFYLLTYEPGLSGNYRTKFKSYPMGKITKQQAIQLEKIAEEIRVLVDKSEPYYVSFIQNDVMYFLNFLSNASQNHQYLNLDTHIEEMKLFLKSSEQLIEEYIEVENKKVNEFGQELANRAIEAHNAHQKMIMQKHKDYSLKKDK